MSNAPKLTAVDKALVVLNCVGRLSSQGEVRMADLVEASGLQRAVVHRSLVSLKNYGLVKQDGHGFQLGGKILELASFAFSNMDIRRLAKPIMQQFSDLTAQTIHLALRDHLEVVYIDKIESRQEIVLASAIGWRGDVHCTALGKAMLAYSEQSVREAMYAKALVKKTDQTLTVKEQLEAELTTVRECGYAIDDRENENEIRCVAVPILDQQGLAIAGISVSGTVTQVTMEKAHQYGQLLAQACAKLSAELGYSE